MVHKLVLGYLHLHSRMWMLQRCLMNKTAFQFGTKHTNTDLAIALLFPKVGNCCKKYACKTSNSTLLTFFHIPYLGVEWVEIQRCTYDKEVENIFCFKEGNFSIHTTHQVKRGLYWLVVGAIGLPSLCLLLVLLF